MSFGMTEDQQRSNAQYAAHQQYLKLFGKAPDQATLDQLTPIYMADGNGVTQGNAAVAKLFQAQQNQQQNDPTVLAQKQRDSLQAQAPKYYDQVKQQYQSVLGRDPTQAELDHFAPMFASGDADAYSIGQALQALPEYTQKQDAGAQEDLRKNLSSADQTYFQQNLMPAITSQFAQSGRMTDSGSAPLAAAFAQAGQQQNAAREQYLAQTQHGNYANNRQTLLNNYLANQNQATALSNFQMQGANDLARNTYDQANQVTDYGIQQSAYQNYLNQMGRRQSGSGLGGALSGALTGAAAGAKLGPWGALAGGVAGGTTGYFASKNSTYSSY